MLQLTTRGLTAATAMFALLYSGYSLFMAYVIFLVYHNNNFTDSTLLSNTMVKCSSHSSIQWEQNCTIKLFGLVLHSCTLPSQTPCSWTDQTSLLLWALTVVNSRDTSVSKASCHLSTTSSTRIHTDLVNSHLNGLTCYWHHWLQPFPYLVWTTTTIFFHECGENDNHFC